MGKYRNTPRNEQEITINISRNDKTASIWTNDITCYTKLDKLVEKNPKEWINTATTEINGEIASKEYKCSKNLISFRLKTASGSRTEQEEEPEETEV